MTLATRGRWPGRIPWERGRAVGLPPLGARARAPPAPQWRPEIARYRLAPVASAWCPWPARRRWRRTKEDRPTVYVFSGETIDNCFRRVRQ